MAQGQSNPSLDVKKISGNPVSINTGAADNGTQRVVIATDQSSLPVQIAASVPINANVITLPGSVSADISAVKASTESIENAVALDGQPSQSGIIRVGGTDGTNDQTFQVTSDGRLNISDGGNSITVDGTVAAVQSGVWNVGSVQQLPVVTIAADQSVDVQKIGGEAIASGAGNVTSGVLRVIDAGQPDAIQSNPTLNTISTTILAANSQRLGASVYNGQSVDVFIRLSSLPASQSIYTVKLQQEDYYEVPAHYTGPISAILSIGTSTSVQVTEIS